MAGKLINPKTALKYKKDYKKYLHRQKKGTEFDAQAVKAIKEYLQDGCSMVIHPIIDNEYFGGWESVMIEVLDKGGNTAAVFQKGKPQGD